MTNLPVFIDFDGTIADAAERHYRAYSICIERFQGLALGFETYWSLKRVDTPWSAVLAKSKVRGEHQADFLAEFIELIESPELLVIDQLLPTAREALIRLSDTRRLVLVSLRRHADRLDSQLDRLNLRSFFSDVLTGHSDTKAGSLQKKAEVIRAWGDFEGGVIIGDTEADISAGNSLGITSIAVTTGIRDAMYLSQYKPSIIVDSLSAAAGLLVG